MKRGHVGELDKCDLSVLTMLQMKDGRPSTSPKHEKQTEHGEDDPYDRPDLHRSAVCTILHMTKRMPDIQATARWLCKRLRDCSQKSWRQLVKTARYIKGSRDLATFMPRLDKPDRASRLTSMETVLATTLTESLHLEVFADCLATAGRLDNMPLAVERVKS